MVCYGVNVLGHLCACVMITNCYETEVITFANDQLIKCL